MKSVKLKKYLTAIFYNPSLRETESADHIQGLMEMIKLLDDPRVCRYLDRRMAERVLRKVG